jgi:hypothetical protein
MCKYKIFLHPCDEMIFKWPFNNLMKEVRRDELVDICTWKIIHEWLQKIVLDVVIQSQSGGEYNILSLI